VTRLDPEKLAKLQDLRPALREPGPPLPMPPAEAALKVTQAYFDAVRKGFLGGENNDLNPQAFAPFLVTFPAEDDNMSFESPLVFGSFFPGILSMWAQEGALEFTPGRAPGQGEVTFRPQPLRLALVKVEGGWKIDLGGLYTHLPPLVRTMTDKDLAQRKATRLNLAQCLEHVKQLTAAALKYAQDHGGALPTANKWTDQLQPYLPDKAVLKCPAFPQQEYGYAMNQALSGLKLDAVAKPAEAILFFDSEQGTRNAAAAPAGGWRHPGGMVCGYVDGHAKLAQPGELMPPLGAAPQGGPPGPPGPPPTHPVTPPPAPGAGGPPPGE
jgi:prepilin-type processing-associated H-X9-DG protein